MLITEGISYCIVMTIGVDSTERITTQSNICAGEGVPQWTVCPHATCHLTHGSVGVTRNRLLTDQRCCSDGT